MHPIAVADLVASVTDEQEMIAAALLHDTVEDTDATLEDIKGIFGVTIALWVENLTDISRPIDGNRAERKMIDLNHTAKAFQPAKTIKLADLIHNTSSIVEYDPEFAKIYMKEKRELLCVLGEGHPTIYQKACELVRDYFEPRERGSSSS